MATYGRVAKRLLAHHAVHGGSASRLPVAQPSLSNARWPHPWRVPIDRSGARGSHMPEGLSEAALAGWMARSLISGLDQGGRHADAICRCCVSPSRRASSPPSKRRSRLADGLATSCCSAPRSSLGGQTGAACRFIRCRAGLAARRPALPFHGQSPIPTPTRRCWRACAQPLPASWRCRIRGTARPDAYFRRCPPCRRPALAADAPRLFFAAQSRRRGPAATACATALRHSVAMLDHDTGVGAAIWLTNVGLLPAPLRARHRRCAAAPRRRLPPNPCPAQFRLQFRRQSVRAERAQLPPPRPSRSRCLWPMGPSRTRPPRWYVQLWDRKPRQGLAKVTHTDRALGPVDQHSPAPAVHRRPTLQSFHPRHDGGRPGPVPRSTPRHDQQPSSRLAGQAHRDLVAAQGPPPPRARQEAAGTHHPLDRVDRRASASS